MDRLCIYSRQCGRVSPARALGGACVQMVGPTGSVDRGRCTRAEYQRGRVRVLHGNLWTRCAASLGEWSSGRGGAGA